MRVQGNSGPLQGAIRVPGDKSISHRSVMLGALAEGVTEVTGFLPGADCLATARIMQQMGAHIETLAVDHLRVTGVGAKGLQEPGDILNVDNSGTSMRLISGIIAGQGFYATLTGDASIRRRPMDRVLKPLREMGAVAFGREGGRLAPLTFTPAKIQPIHYQSPVASAQIKSAVLLAGLFTEGETSVTEPELSRDHSERMLAGFGATVQRTGLTATVVGRPKLTAQKVEVPGDISSAAFFLVAAATRPGSEVLLENVGVNPTRTGILDILTAMGAQIELLNVREAAGEPVADLLVRGSELKGTKIGGAVIPRAIDELPVVAVAAALAQGTTEIRDAAELRVKESDRISALAGELRKLGVQVEELPDGMIIEGGHPLTGAPVESHHDHRLAMSLAVAALSASGETVIAGAEAVAVSFPHFGQNLRHLGGDVA